MTFTYENYTFKLCSAFLEKDIDGKISEHYRFEVGDVTFFFMVYSDHLISYPIHFMSSSHPKEEVTDSKKYIKIRRSILIYSIYFFYNRRINKKEKTYIFTNT